VPTATSPSGETLLDGCSSGAAVLTKLVTRLPLNGGWPAQLIYVYVQLALLSNLIADVTGQGIDLHLELSPSYWYLEPPYPS